MTDFLTTPEVAEILHCSVSKLEKSRCSGALQIPFIRCGRLILYPRNELQKWLTGQELHTNTSQYIPHKA